MTIHARRGIRRYDKERGCYVYDIAFKSTAQETPRTIKVAESFGLGISDEHVHILYDDFELRLAQGDVLYITGDSGSGKSVLLDAIRRDLGDEAASLNNLPEPGTKPIIDTIGPTFNDALKLLGRVGLSDAYLFLRPYHELSEGQRYRYRLAQLLDSGQKIWLCDEFLSTLDRTTAKIVAHNIQKQARRCGATLIVATTHRDLAEDLNPSIQVTKGWGQEINIKYSTVTPRPCTVNTGIDVSESNKDDYKQLAYLHYRGTRVTAPWRYYKMSRGNELVGVIVYTYPPIRLGGRKDAVGYSPDLTELNRDWTLISRVIIHPKYRGIGLGTRIIKETLQIQGRKHVELVAVMAQYSPFAERAGMTPVKIHEPHESIPEAIENLRPLGFNPIRLASKDHNLQALCNLDDRNMLVEALQCIVTGPYIRRLTRKSKPYVSKPEFKDWILKQANESLAQMLQTLSILNQTKAYLHWVRASG